MPDQHSARWVKKVGSVNLRQSNRSGSRIGQRWSLGLPWKCSSGYLACRTQCRHSHPDRHQRRCRTRKWTSCADCPIPAKNQRAHSQLRELVLFHCKRGGEEPTYLQGSYHAVRAAFEANEALACGSIKGMPSAGLTPVPLPPSVEVGAPIVV